MAESLLDILASSAERVETMPTVNGSAPTPAPYAGQPQYSYPAIPGAMNATQQQQQQSQPIQYAPMPVHQSLPVYQNGTSVQGGGNGWYPMPNGAAPAMYPVGAGQPSGQGVVTMPQQSSGAPQQQPQPQQQVGVYSQQSHLPAHPTTQQPGQVLPPASSFDHPAPAKQVVTIVPPSKYNNANQGAKEERQPTIVDIQETMRKGRSGAVKRKRGATGGNYPCEKCSKTFSTQSLQTRHMKNVHAPKTAECKYCSKAFANRQQLQLHQDTVHLNKKNFKCNLCGKAFGHKHHVVTHQKTVHFGLKEFKCQYCSYECGQRGHLTIHINTIHLNKTNFKCDHCTSEFARKETLLKHVSTVHLGRKDYRCQYCDKAYGHKSSLTTHLSSVHGPQLRNEAAAAGGQKAVPASR